MFRITPRAFSFAIILLGASATALRAQQDADTGHIDAATRRQIVLAVAQTVEDYYVFPDTARRMAEALRAKAERDGYASDVTANELGAALTGDLRDIAHDKHLAVLTPAMLRQLPGRGNGGAVDVEARVAEERRHNFYFEEYRSLPGNVGYLRFRQFPFPEKDARETAVAAMRLLANADAVILDLRDNRGGVEGFNQLLSSYFVADSSRVLYRRYYRQGDSTAAIHVLAHLDGPRMPQVPVYILVNAGTGSAAENMAYALQTLGRAKIIGEPTAGGANSSTVLPLPAGFAMQVAVGRVISPVTATNWEGVGVQPDVHVPSDSALVVAQQLALARAPQEGLAQKDPTKASGSGSGATPGPAPRSDSTPPGRVVMSKTVEVPLMSDRSGRPMVDVTVNGRGPYRFLLETGARSIDLPQSLIDSLRLRHTGHGPDEPQYHVDSINIGGASFQDITVNAMPAGVAAMGVAGVLGLPFYQNVLLTLDYPAGRVRFSSDTLPTPDGRDVLPLVRVGAFWGLSVVIAGRQQTAVLDTQNSSQLIVPPVVADQLAFVGGVRTVGRARTAAGPVDIKEGQLTGDVAIGRYTFPSPVLSVLEMPPGFPRRPNVGAGILRNFVVSIDQRHARLRLAHAGSPVIPLPTPAGRATAPAAGDGNASLAAYTGSYGDRIVTVSDGKLILTRPGGAPNELTMTARDSFTIRDIPQARIAFLRDSTGAVAAIRVLTSPGVWETAKRSGP